MMQFPQFRRYPNGKSYFRIDSAQRMTEVQILGRYYVLHEMEAAIWPERLFISDLLKVENVEVQVIDQAAYTEFLDDCRRNREQKAFGV